MEARFARSLERLHRVGSSRLADSIGSYQPLQGAASNTIPLQVARDVELAGPNGSVIGVPIAVSFWRRDLAEVERGGVFLVGVDCAGQRLIVEEVVMDDGHMLTAACTEDV
ncbi:hypothetical protein [Pseudomonas sp. GV071]|uniref:hypothetical protein n=1 Tax=Pseudomonas sp. GV071 TaxID=2135754 RepID=UPI000D34CBA8|nr:hypothetical protein [Pseudomonas sp. GV071]PTQ70357.1 hypothetical protein C8K61_10679 [Pseudomonas sp. GV071]